MSKLAPQSENDQLKLIKKDYQKRINTLKNIFDHKSELRFFVQSIFIYLLIFLLMGPLLSIGHSWAYGFTNAGFIIGAVLFYHIFLEPVWRRLIKNDKTI